MNKICVHCHISGKVQGVFFRQNTKNEAEKLFLSGWVKNSADGSVEAIICGDVDNINKMKEWLKKGPPRSIVEGLEIKDIELQNFSSFEVIR